MHDRPTAQDHAQRARRHARQRRWGKALRAYDRALAQEPQHAQWWLGRGRVLDMLDRLRDAAESYGRAANLAPQDPDAWRRLGAALLHLGEPGQAIDALEHAGRLDPDDHTSSCHRVAAYARLGDPDQAELMFYLGQQQEPDCPHCFDHVAHALAGAGRLEQAVYCWQRARDIDPAHPHVGVNLARCHAFLDHPGRAQHHYEQHLAHHRNDTDAALELAALLLGRGKLDAAEQHLNANRAVRPDDDAALHLRGDLALKRGDPHTAECYYHRALQMHPDRPGVCLGLALAARERGDRLACVEHLLRELDLTGQDAKQVLQLAGLLIEHDRYHEADALLCPAVDGLDDIFRGNDTLLARALHLRAVAAVAVGQHTDVIADCRRSLRLAPDNPRGWRLLIQAYLDTDRPRRARVCLNKARAVHPNDPALRKLAHQLRWQRLTRAA